MLLRTCRRATRSLARASVRVPRARGAGGRYGARFDAEHLGELAAVELFGVARFRHDFVVERSCASASSSASRRSFCWIWALAEVLRSHSELTPKSIRSRWALRWRKSGTARCARSRTGRCGSSRRRGSPGSSPAREQRTLDQVVRFRSYLVLEEAQQRAEMPREQRIARLCVAGAPASSRAVSLATVMRAGCVRVDHKQ